ncbi:hypothetical protein ACWENO_13890 [Streptomyces sp. NPDC004436]
MPADPWSSSLSVALYTFNPTAADMEATHYGLLVASLYGEDNDGELIVVGPDLTPRRAFAAMHAYMRTECRWPGYNAAAELRDRIRDNQLAIAIVPTQFIREADGGWSTRWHAQEQPAAWLVSPRHPAHSFTTT